MSKGYAKRYFAAIGQSDKARHVPMIERRRQAVTWPLWARQTYQFAWTFNDQGRVK